jgi:hypothetical protein
MVDEELQIVFSLKGKKFGGVLHEWVIIPKTQTRSHYAHGILYEGLVSVPSDYYDTTDRYINTSSLVMYYTESRIIETRNSYYILGNPSLYNGTDPAILPTYIG